MVFHDGELAGLQLAASFVDDNAPDWLTDFAQKSNVEFELVAMEGEYTLGSFGRIESGAGYSSGISAGIQEYIDQMNSIGQPVWFTDSEDPTGVSSLAPNISAFNPPRLEREDWNRRSANPPL